VTPPPGGLPRRPPSRAPLRWQSKAGSVALELVLAVVALVLPLVWLLSTLAVLQRSAYAVDHAAREAARAFAAATSEPAAVAGAHDVARAILDAAGRSYDPSQLRIDCHAGCLLPGSAVSVTVEHPVHLPGVGAWLDADGVTVRSTVTVPVGSYRAGEGGSG